MNSNRKFKSKKSGHTLAEVMFALLLLAVCSLIFGATIPSAHKSRGKADNANIATSLAQKQMETLRLAGYANLTPSQMAAKGLIDSANAVSTNTYTFTNIDSPFVDSPATVLPQGVGKVTVADVNSDSRSVTVVIQWVEGAKTQTITLSSLVANL